MNYCNFTYFSCDLFPRYIFIFFRENGKPCHRLITWKDCRARDECKKWNNSWSLKVLILFLMLSYFPNILNLAKYIIIEWIKNEFINLCSNEQIFNVHVTLVKQKLRLTFLILKI